MLTISEKLDFKNVLHSKKCHLLSMLLNFLERLMFCPGTETFVNMRLIVFQYKIDNHLRRGSRGGGPGAQAPLDPRF